MKLTTFFLLIFLSSTAFSQLPETYEELKKEAEHQRFTAIEWGFCQEDGKLLICKSANTVKEAADINNALSRFYFTLKHFEQVLVGSGDSKQAELLATQIDLRSLGDAVIGAKKILNDRDKEIYGSLEVLTRKLHEDTTIYFTLDLAIQPLLGLVAYGVYTGHDPEYVEEHKEQVIGDLARYNADVGALLNQPDIQYLSNPKHGFFEKVHTYTQDLVRELSTEM